MGARKQAFDPGPYAEPRRPDGDPKARKILRDEEKSKEQLIDELFELRQRVADLEDAHEKRLNFVQGEINFAKGILTRSSHVKTLTGLLPICTSCKKIRDDQGYWNQLEIYILEHSEAEFTHGLCPECVKKFYPVDVLTRAKDDPQPGSK